MEFFERPTLFDESSGQPVEKFGVRGLFARAAEVIGVAGERLAKVPKPDAINDGAGSERIGGVGDPGGERGSTAFDRGGDRGRRRETDSAEHAGGDGLLASERIAVRQDARLFEFALSHAGGGHPHGCVDGFQLRRATGVDGEGHGLVAVEFPPEAFKTFASDALVAVVLGAKADQFRRELVFRNVFSGEDSASLFEDAVELTPTAGTFPALGRSLGHGGSPSGRVKVALSEP